MPDFDMLPPRTRAKKISALVILSYAFDWLIMVVVGLIGYFLGHVTPNKRPFSLLDANIAYVAVGLGSTACPIFPVFLSLSIFYSQIVPSPR